MSIGGKVAIGSTCVLVFALCVSESRQSGRPAGQATASFIAGQHVTLTAHAFECRDGDHLDRLLSLGKTDGAAGVRFLDDPSNGCRMTPVARDAIVEEYSAWNGTVTLHEVGDPTRWVVNSGHVQ